MNIFFKRVHLRNFLSFQDAEVDLTQEGFILVSGTNNNKVDLASSNGAGKSAIFESITWALTQETIRGTKQIVNLQSSGGACVELEFSIDNIDYTIIRYKDDEKYGNNLRLFVNGKEETGKGLRDSSKKLEELIPGLDASLLGSVIILGQGLPQRFTNNTPSGRKEVLEKLSKSDFMIQDIKDKLSRRKEELSVELRSVENLIIEQSSKEEIYAKRISELEAEQKELTSIISFDEEIKQEEATLTDLKNTLTTTTKDLRLAEENLNKKLEEYTSTKAEEVEKINSDERLIKGVNFITEQQNRLTKLNTLIEQKNEILAKFNGGVEYCPTCHQKLPNIDKIDIASLKAEVGQLSKEASEVKQLLERAQIKHEANLKSLRAEFDNLLESLKNSGKELREEYNAKKENAEKLNKAINTTELKIEKLKLSRDSFKEKKEKIESELNNISSIYLTNHNKMCYNKEAKEIVGKKIEIVTKMLSIATREFRGYLLSWVIDYINKKAKEFCLSIFDTEGIDFVLDGNAIRISYLGKDYENLSGGEKQKIDLIVQFSLRGMLIDYIGFSSNILVLDEIFDNLDSVGCQRVLDFISKEVTDVVGVYIITHHTDIDIPYDKQLLIQKDSEGVSKITNE